MTPVKFCGGTVCACRFASISARRQNQPRPPSFFTRPARVITFDELEARANRLAHHFRRAGLAEGDAVAILMENNEHMHAVMWAARRSGLYYVPINTHLTAAEAAYIVDNSAAKAIIGSAALRKTCENLGEHLPGGLPGLLMIADDDHGRLAALPGMRCRRNRIHRSTTNAKAICCSIRRAPPAGPRASNANCRTYRPPRRPG